MSKHPSRWPTPLFIAVLAGTAYGSLSQLLARSDSFEDLHVVMSLGFVMVLPVVLGIVTVLIAGVGRGWLFCLMAPWLTATVSMLLALLVGWEGTLCLILAMPITLAGASLGGLFTWLWRKVRSTTAPPPLVLAGILLMPVASGVGEGLMPLPESIRRVHTEIAIDAPAEVVWQHIIRVPPITEPQTGVFYRLGFPRPVAATLSHEGHGGVRHASFERGLLFIETVTEWQPPRDLAFKIAVDPQHTPPTTLDPHITVGGRYFDVLSGHYRIVPRPGGVLLQLWSDHRLSTSFNFYARLWSDFLMRDIQRSILGVIKSRCERAAAPPL